MKSSIFRIGNGLKLFELRMELRNEIADLNQTLSDGACGGVAIDDEERAWLEGKRDAYRTVLDRL